MGHCAEISQLIEFSVQESPGYLLVEALAGFGKSALIYQLIHLYETGGWELHPKPNLLYFFIRKDDNRNTPVSFLQALNSQLLKILNLPGDVPIELSALRNQFSELWSQARLLANREQPLLLLVDGLDEMAIGGDVTIAKLLPSLTSYTHVIVTSRPNPQLLQLVSPEHSLKKASVLRLQKFDESDIKALLQKYSEPDLPLKAVQTALLSAYNTDKVATIAEFLLLHAQRLLQTTTKDTPLDGLRKNDLNRAFAIADLYEIERSALWYLLLAWELKDAGKLKEAQVTLDKLRQKRLVCGFGLRAGTYVMRACYPDYAAYMLAYISDISLDAFTDLTKRLLHDDQQLLLCKTLSQRSHIYLTVALEIALSMDDNWSKIQALADIGAAQALSSDRTAAQKTFTFILDTAQPIDDKYKLIAAAQAKAGDINAAVETVHKIENKENQIWALGQIAIAQAKVGQIEKARANLATALENARKIDNIRWKSKKSQALQEVAIAQAKTGFADDALETAKETGWSCTRGNVLISVVRMY